MEYEKKIGHFQVIPRSEWLIKVSETFLNSLYVGAVCSK